MSEFTAEEIEGIVQAITAPQEKLDKVPLRPIYRVEFAELHEEKKGEKGSFENLPVEIEVIYGKTMIPLKRLLNFRVGEVISMDEDVEQRLEICANGKKIGYGEVVTAGGKFGIKIVELLNS